MNDDHKKSNTKKLKFKKNEKKTWKENFKKTKKLKVLYSYYFKGVHKNDDHKTMKRW